MNKKSACFRLVLGVCLLYLGTEWIRYLWIGIPLMVCGVLGIISYIRQMRKKVED